MVARPPGTRPPTPSGYVPVAPTRCSVRLMAVPLASAPTRVKTPSEPPAACAATLFHCVPSILAEKAPFPEFVLGPVELFPQASERVRHASKGAAARITEDGRQIGPMRIVSGSTSGGNQTSNYGLIAQEYMRNRQAIVRSCSQQNGEMTLQRAEASRTRSGCERADRMSEICGRRGQLRCFPELAEARIPRDELRLKP